MTRELAEALIQLRDYGYVDISPLASERPYCIIDLSIESKKDADALLVLAKELVKRLGQ